MPDAPKGTCAGCKRKRTSQIAWLCCQPHSVSSTCSINHYAAGNVDAHLQLRGNLQHPQIGGNIRFSRGTASLNPQASAPAPSGSAGTDSQVAEPDIVSKAFKALAAHNDGLARQLDRLEVLHVRLVLEMLSLFLPVLARASVFCMRGGPRPVNSTLTN